MRVVNNTRQSIGNGPAPTTPVAPTYTNHPVTDASITLTVGGRSLTVEFENEKDVRNFMARLVPTAVFEAHPQTVLEHLDDSTQPLIEFAQTEANRLGLSYPQLD